MENGTNKTPPNNHAPLMIASLLFVMFGALMISFQCMSHAEIQANTKRLDATYQLLHVIKNKVDTILVHQPIIKKKAK